MPRVAIVRSPGPALARCELTYLAREPIDVEKAEAQHIAYGAALREAGVDVRVLPAGDAWPDAAFVEDAAVVLDDLAIIARPGSESRRGEVATVAAELARRRRLREIEPPGTLDGGDVLVIDHRIFVGLSSRTNPSGFAQVAQIAGGHGYRTTAVPVAGCLHLKTAVTALDPSTLLINPDWLDAAAFSDFRQFRVSAGEPFAANTLTLDGLTWVSARWTRTRDMLEKKGFETRPLDISEFEKAEAGLTCLSLVFEETEYS